MQYFRYDQQGEKTGSSEVKIPESKAAVGAQPLIYPMPALLIGADVDGKPNFMTAAWCGIACSEPPMVSVGIRHRHHTLKGIKQNMAFSVNVPSVDLVTETDYCGITSGSKADKVAVCQFRVFYGNLGGAPLIEQCPLNLECKAVHLLDLGSHCLVIGRVEQTYVSKDCLSEGKPDVSKIRPFIFTPFPAVEYQALGEVIAKAFTIGRELKAKEKKG